VVSEKDRASDRALDEVAAVLVDAAQRPEVAATATDPATPQEEEEVA
jgi:hypothetical protein